ncbi:MAG: SDR family oxidoreductase [Armatimonadetes bacterium]|nr:SDR family oxidoreductase [Candidatus Hippobium faecium]
MFEIKNKVIAVTGASGVLCSQICRALGKAGAKVALLGRTFEKLEKLSLEIPGSLPVVCDVLDKDSLIKAYDTVKENLGIPDVLINGAGGNNPGATTSCEVWSENCDGKSFFDISQEAFVKVFDLNILGTVLTSQVFAKDMAGRGGSVINISSMNAFTPLTKIPAYSAAKAGVSNLTEWMAVHFAPAHIRVNAIAPGFFLTEQNRFLLTKEDGSLSERGNKIISHTPMERFGDPQDLEGAVIFLASEASAFITGTVLPIDGGFNAYSGV